MLTLQNLSISRGNKTLLEDVNLAVFEKNVIGILGSNGCGKSSLFSVIRNELEPSGGSIKLRKDLRIANLDQEVPGLDMSILDHTISGDAPLFEVINKLAQAELTDDYETSAECYVQLHEMNGYDAQARAAKILTGLGFSQEDMQQPVKKFSGGWRMRVGLAKCLFAPSELMLLDEPTNHLDMEAIIWLENFLKNYAGGILMVSHDQDFLDSTTTHIAHVDNHQVKLYTGNYSNFEVLYAQYIALQNAQHRKQQLQVAHMMKFVERFRSKASKAKQAQSRLKAVEKMELVKPIYDSSPFKFKFYTPGRMPNPMLSMKRVTLGYPDKVILKQVNFSFVAGQRVGLLGVNGAGKSTFIKGICGELSPLQGIIERPGNLVIGYFAQHQVDHLPLNDSVLSMLQKMSDKPEKELMAYLGSFGFNREQALSPLENFSGGEKSRVALALIVWQRPNLLLLDEPTNHLDLEMRQALSFALQTYEGALILVSHDRRLMKALVDELYLVENGKLERFDGSVEDYQLLYT